MYKHVVSFGCMCSTANYLKQIGLRENSSFFDWIDSNLEGNISLVKNNFSDCLNKQYLRQFFVDCPHIITNIKYGFSYVHCFNSKRSFNSQINSIKKKAKKQINNFMNCLQDGDTLLVYYCRSKKEQNWIENNQEYILSFTSNNNCDLLFIFNDSISIPSFAFNFFVVEANEIHRPFGGKVSYPISGSAAMKEWLIKNYNEQKRANNLLFLSKKRKRNFLNGFINKFFKKDILKV